MGSYIRNGVFSDAGARMPEYVTLVKVLKPADDGVSSIY